MARQITTLYRAYASGTAGVTVASGTGVGKLRIIQTHFSNNAATAQTFMMSLSGSYGSGQPVIPTFSIPAGGTKTYNGSYPLTAGDVISVTMSNAACSVVVVGEEID